MAEGVRHKLNEGALFAERYHIERLLGEGGMGRVFLARDNMLGEEHVALKVLHSNLCSDEKHVKRFLREIQLTRKITHPNIVRTFEVGTEQGTLYFSMEYAPGKTLKELAAAESLDARETARIVAEVAKGLAAIHEVGIIHRDLKPGNIICTPERKIKITDFGIARPGISDLTGQDEVLGSIRYLAPEGWLGRDVGTASDIYALGVVAYELLTGIVPFDGEGAAELMFKHLQSKPVPPSEIIDLKLSWLEGVILQMLEKEQDQRPAAVQIAERIEACLCARVDCTEAMPRSLERGDCRPSSADSYLDAPVIENPPPESAWAEGWSDGRSSPELEGRPAVSEKRLSAVRRPSERLSGAHCSPAAPTLGTRAVPESDRASSGFEAAADPYWHELGAYLTRVPAALGLLVVMGAVALGPLAGLARALWGVAAAAGGRHPALFVAGGLLMLAVYAVIAAVPAVSLALLFHPVKAFPAKWAQLSLYLWFTVGLLAAVYSVWMVSDWKAAQSRAERTVIAAALEEGARGAVSNLLEVSALLPRGSIYKVGTPNGGPVLYEGERSPLAGLLLYYVMLAAYILGIIVCASREPGAEAGAGSRVMGMMAVMAGVCAAEYLLFQLFSGGSAWKAVVVKPGGELTGFRGYALLCGLINWVLIAILLVRGDRQMQQDDRCTGDTARLKLLRQNRSAGTWQV